jgi:hypothetical protein
MAKRVLFPQGGTLGVPVIVSEGELSPEWEETIRKLNEHGAKIAPELRRKEARAMKEAYDLGWDGTW